MSDSDLDSSDDSMPALVSNSESESDSDLEDLEPRQMLNGNASVSQEDDDAAAIDALLKELRPLFGDMSKAKAAKLVRTLIDVVAQIPDSLDLQVRMCEESIAWTVEEKRTFLRHRLQASFLCVSCGFLTSCFIFTDEAGRALQGPKELPSLDRAHQ